MLTLPIHVYEGEGMFTSQHSVPVIKKDAIKVDFYSEFGIEDFVLKSNLRQKVFFQVVTNQTNKLGV